MACAHHTLETYKMAHPRASLADLHCTLDFPETAQNVFQIHETLPVREAADHGLGR